MLAREAQTNIAFVMKENPYNGRKKKLVFKMIFSHDILKCFFISNKFRNKRNIIQLKTMTVNFCPFNKHSKSFDRIFKNYS